VRVDPFVVDYEVADLRRRPESGKDLDGGPEFFDVDEPPRLFFVVETEDGRSREKTQTKSTINATGPIS
jgi:hypothetical protein